MRYGGLIRIRWYPVSNAHVISIFIAYMTYFRFAVFLVDKYTDSVIEKINIHTMLPKMIWYRCSYKCTKDLEKYFMIYIYWLPVQFELWMVRTIVKYYGAKMNNCAFQSWHFYMKTRVFSKLLIKAFCVSFKWPSLFHHTTIKIIFLHAYAFLLYYVNQGNAFNTTQQIYTTLMKSEWFVRESRRND